MTKHDDEQRQKKDEPYNKMVGRENFGNEVGSGVPDETNTTVGAGNTDSGTIPEGVEASGSSVGGINTSNSIVSGGGTAGGTNIGLGATTDRGRMNTAPDLAQNSDPIMSMGPRANAEAHNPPPKQQQTDNDTVVTDGQIVPDTDQSKGASPLSEKEARRITRDERTSVDVPVPNDVGHERY